MKNEEGLPTNALYGVLKMLYQIIEKKQPDYMVCCFDSKEPSFRKDMYSEYKANRSEMPEDLEVQVPYLKTMMDRFLISSWENPGFEADDLIASLVSFAKTKKWETYIVSGDKDFSQIVDHNVFLYDTMKDLIYNPEGVEEKWGLPPSQMQDYLSLTGDSSDNIPGVKGIGPKGAIRLLKSYRNLEGIYSHIEEVKKSLKEKLLKDKEMAFLSKELVALKKDVPWKKDFFNQTLKRLADFSEEEKAELKKFLEELNFKSFIKKFFPVKTESPKPLKDSWEDAKQTSKTSPQTKERSSSSEEEKSFFHSDSLLNQTGLVSVFGTKITHLSLEDFKRKIPPYANLWIGCHGDIFYLSYEKYFVLLKNLKGLADFLDYKWVRYSGQDLKFFWKKLQIKNPVAQWDSLIAGHLLSSKSSPKLSDLFKSYLNVSLAEDSNALFQQIILEKQLEKKLFSELKRTGMETLFQTIELPLINVLYSMEQKGILLDLKEIEKHSSDLEQDIKNLEFQIYKLSGEEFNLSSPKQLGKILFEKLQLPRGRKRKTIYSTNSYELMKIKDLHPILPLLLEYRELFKLKSSYTDNLISLRDKKTGRIHTEFKQAIASTGRLSSINPNLQNIPIRTERGRLIRKAFIAEKKHTLISADYSQLELRILAHITGDNNLCQAFEEGLDIHSQTASELFNVPLDEVSPELRRKSKAVNFGIAYGQGVYGLAENLSISRSEAKEIIENYFKKFKKIKDYIETIKEELPKKNFVETLYGRKRFFQSEDLRHPRFRSAIERAAINAPLQGTASDLVKKAMIALDESLPIPILSQVHDELLFECPKEYVERESREILSIMEENDVLKVPLKVNLAQGTNWFMAHS